MSGEMRLAVDNELLEIGRFCAACNAFAGIKRFHPRRHLCRQPGVGGTATNIVKYGYDDLARHKIQVQSCAWTAIWQRLCWRMTDMRSIPGSRRRRISGSLWQTPIGGLGIHLARRMADSMQYRRDNGRNILTIKVRSAPAPAAAGGVNV